jgi:pimeloyl-ACP methyl ester carboxylesterase
VARQLRSAAPLHLLGHSFGGLVARAAVLAEPTLFDSLTLLGSGPARLTGPRAELLGHLAPLLEAGGVQLVNDTLEQLAMTDPRAQAVPAPTREFLTRRFLANSAAGLRGMADAMLAEPDRVAELAATGVPVLVAHGVADDAWSPAEQADMAQRLGARHEVIGHAVHSPAIENPARTLQVLLSFWGGPAAATVNDDQAEAVR